MTVDPILPLSISIAQGERTYALFLGSGMSVKAGIPTGGEILDNTIKLLYKMENGVEEFEDLEAKEWFKESEYAEWGYSDILESLYPSQEDRRNFLETFFLDKVPTDGHNLIAEMVEKNLIKCIITTNFDRLMEDALKNKGISYDVVATINDLNDLKPREHSNCRIFKLHGDYQKSNIKNTKDELEKLEEELEEEFKDILNKYGIVVIGYSGSDNGIMDCLECRENQRYTLYWLVRENVNGRVENLIQEKEGKKIKRNSADEFLEELVRKIEIFQAHETGETPEFLIQQTINFMQENDYIGFLATLKKQMNIIKKKWEKIYDETNDKSLETYGRNHEEAMDISMSGFKEFEKYVNVITGIGLSLIEYNFDSYFEPLLDALIEISELSDFMRERPGNNHSPFLPALYIPRAVIYNIYYCWGAMALKKENFNILKQLLDLKITTNDLAYPEMELEEIWHYLNGENIITFNRNSIGIFKFLLESYEEKDFLNEFFRSYDVFYRYLCQFSFIINIYSLKKYDAIASPPSTKLGRLSVRKFIVPLLFKIKNDSKFRYSVAEALDEIEERFNTNTNELVEVNVFIENYPDRCEKLNSSNGGFGTIPCDFFS